MQDGCDNNRLSQPADDSGTPDFEVEWGNPSRRFAEDVYCEPTPMAEPQRSRLRDALASIKTETTHVEVSEINFAEPVSINFTPHRPGFSLLISKSSTTMIDYGYRSDSHQTARLENVLFMVPGLEISGNISAGSFRSVTCSFEPTYAERTLGSLERLSSPQLAQALDMRSALITCALLRLMNEALFPGPISTVVVESLGNTLLVECAHSLLVADQQQPLQGRLTLRHIQTIENYLSSLSSKAPSVSELAAACGFSERHFARLFKQQFGCSVSQYLKSIQISKAKAYLLETDLALKEVAFRLGFSSVSNFSYAFREATGLSPGQFRKTDQDSAEVRFS